MQVPFVLLDLQSSRIVLWRFAISISFSGLQILKKPRFGIARIDETAGRINPDERIVQRSGKSASSGGVTDKPSGIISGG